MSTDGNDKDPGPPPITKPTQPQGPGNTGGSGSGKRREEHLDNGRDGALRLWSLCCPSAVGSDGANG